MDRNRENRDDENLSKRKKGVNRGKELPGRVDATDQKRGTSGGSSIEKREGVADDQKRNGGKKMNKT